jgi:hypothetical protein
MQDRPSAAELVLAVKEHLEREVMPAQKSPKLRFQTLVAAHVLSVVLREIEHGEKAAREELASLRALQGDDGAPAPATSSEVLEEVSRRTRALSAAIRKGDAGDGACVLAHVRGVAMAKLAIANPAYRSLRSP